MSCRCSVCYEWRPKHVDGIGAHDDKAMCNFLKIETERTATCPHGSILDPKNPNLKTNVEKKQGRVPFVRKQMAQPVYVPRETDVPLLELYGHQLEAFEKFKDADEVALFFEMGCGKSLTTLRIAQHMFLQGRIQGLLVVAPNDVHRQWYDELVNGVFIDGVRHQELDIDVQAQCVGGRGGQKELYPFEFGRPNTFKFVSVNVDTFSQPHKWEDIVFWVNQGKYAIAIDEATSIKNPDSKRSQRLLYEFNNVLKRGKRVLSSQKKFPIRFVLTGTPVTNGPIDLWAIMEFLRPNYFNRNYYSFKAYYGMYTKLAVTTSYGTRDVDILLTEKTWNSIHDCETFEEAHAIFGCSEDTYMTIKHQAKFLGPYKHADELKQLLEPVAIFKKLTDCVDMPAVKYIERKVGMSSAQEAAYNQMKTFMLAQFEDHVATASNKLIVNLRLQQISSGFIMGQNVVTESNWDMSVFNLSDEVQIDDKDLTPNEVVWLGDSCPKLDALMRDVDECDKPLLILTRYSAEASKIYDRCKDKYRTGLFTGWKVVGGIDEFKSGELDILVANSSKISRGFNLQIAHTTLFYSNTFSMETRQQAEFRTFRMGQKHSCLYIDYTAAEVDETINKALQQKKNLLEYIRDKDIKEVV